MEMGSQSKPQVWCRGEVGGALSTGWCRDYVYSRGGLAAEDFSPRWEAWQGGRGDMTECLQPLRGKWLRVSLQDPSVDPNPGARPGFGVRA